MLKKMMISSIVSTGLIGTMAVVVPLLTSCTSITQLTLSQTTFDITTVNEHDPYVIKGGDYKGTHMFLCSADKLPITIGDVRATVGYLRADSSGQNGSASILAESLDEMTKPTVIECDFNENGQQTVARDYTIYGYAQTYEENNKLLALTDLNNPNGGANAKVKVPGIAVECKITVTRGQ